MGDLFGSGFLRNGPRDRVGIEVIRLERFPSTLSIAIDFGGQRTFAWDLRCVCLRFALYYDLLRNGLSCFERHVHREPIRRHFASGHLL